MNAESVSPVAAPSLEQIDQIDHLHERLCRAHATLDLIVTLAEEKRNSVSAELGLCAGTLTQALEGAMDDIEAALEVSGGRVRRLAAQDQPRYL